MSTPSHRFSHFIPTQSNLLEILVKYHDTGKYKGDIEEVGKGAIKYMKDLPAPKAGTKQALVLDLDETTWYNNWEEIVDPANRMSVGSRPWGQVFHRDKSKKNIEKKSRNKLQYLSYLPTGRQAHPGHDVGYRLRLYYFSYAQI